MAGATAATAAAGATAAQGGMITINLTGNYISATGGDHLNADLTGDGNADVTIASALHGVNYIRNFSSTIVSGSAAVRLNGVRCAGFFFGDFQVGYLLLGSQSKGLSFSSAALTGSIPITFKDLNINGGARTRGSLEVTVSNFGPFRTPSVQLDSFTYQAPSSVPEQGSSLALLAMGAGGVLALRRWRAARGNACRSISAS